MGNLSTGLKAGVTAGLFDVPVAVILTIITESWLYSAHTQPYFLHFVIFVTIFYGVPFIISGVFIGLVFGYSYTYLPGKTAIIKSIILNVGIWLLRNIYNLSALLQAQEVNIAFYVLLSRSLAVTLVLGYLLGHFWIKFKQKTPEIHPLEENKDT